MVARPVDSAIVDDRAPWGVKCSVVAKVTAAGRGSNAKPTGLDLYPIPAVLAARVVRHQAGPFVIGAAQKAIVACSRRCSARTV